MRMQERVIIDSARLAQTGRWSGQIRSGGEVFEVTPEHWQGSREDPRTTSRAISQTVGRNPDAYGHS